MGMRIEFVQRYWDEEQAAYYVDQVGMKPTDDCWKYRKVYPLLLEVKYPMEIPDDAEHTDILFRDDTILTVKGSFGELKKYIDEQERLADEQAWGG
jgi:hypothetical protein